MHTQVSCLPLIRQEMARQGIDVLLVRSTDVYLNEYVPKEESLRAWATGFDGSMGDALILNDSAHLFVDGRYALQAKQQAKDYTIHVLPLGQSIESGWIQWITQFVATMPLQLEIPLDRLPKRLYDQIANIQNLTLSHTQLLENLWYKENKAKKTKQSSLLPLHHTLHVPISERLSTFQSFFKTNGLDGFLLTLLDDIAWLSNTRGQAFSFQATFPSLGVAFNDHLLLSVPDLEATRGLPSQQGLTWVTKPTPIAQLKAKQQLRLGFDPTSTTQAVYESFVEQGITLVPTSNPFQTQKAIKTAAELHHMRSNFHKADRAVHRVIAWVCESVSTGKNLSEKDVSDRMQEEFMLSGASDLSFSSICAAGSHGAIVHYSTPDPSTLLKEGDLFLLDVGAIYDGYATDLTRTFLIGTSAVSASKQQKDWFTTVLKSAIAGMSMKMPKGTTGTQLDAIVRAPLWNRERDFGHGTGHGIGILVHEFPPRISKTGHWPLEIGHVFSIEPGLYLENQAGIRIENICTVVAHPTKTDWICVVPLTFCPLDERLIDFSMLTPDERAFLDYYQQGFLSAKDHFPTPFFNSR